MSARRRSKETSVDTGRTGAETEVEMGVEAEVAEFPITSVSIETLASALEACAAHPNSDIRLIAEFAGLGASTTLRAVKALQAFGVVATDSSGKHISTAPGVRRGTASSATREAIRRGLIGYRPFEALCEGLALGETKQEAVRRALIILGLERNDADRFDILIRWGRALDLLTLSDGRLVPALDSTFGALGDPTTSIITTGDVESEMKARLYVAKRLGRNAYDYLTENERGLLAQSLVQYSGAPEISVEKAGQVTENILRELASQKGLRPEASKLNGAGQLGTLLVSRGIIHPHHGKLIDSIGTLRNAKAHDKDKKTLVPWEITENASFVAIMTTIAVIRSIYEFTINNRQVL